MSQLQIGKKGKQGQTSAQDKAPLAFPVLSQSEASTPVLIRLVCKDSWGRARQLPGVTVFRLPAGLITSLNRVMLIGQIYMRRGIGQRFGFTWPDGLESVSAYVLGKEVLTKNRKTIGFINEKLSDQLIWGVELHNVPNRGQIPYQSPRIDFVMNLPNRDASGIVPVVMDSSIGPDPPLQHPNPFPSQLEQECCQILEDEIAKAKKNGNTIFPEQVRPRPVAGVTPMVPIQSVGQLSQSYNLGRDLTAGSTLLSLAPPTSQQTYAQSNLDPFAYLSQPTENFATEQTFAQPIQSASQFTQDPLQSTLQPAQLYQQQQPAQFTQAAQQTRVHDISRTNTPEPAQKRQYSGPSTGQMTGSSGFWLTRPNSPGIFTGLQQDRQSTRQVTGSSSAGLSRPNSPGIFSSNQQSGRSTGQMAGVWDFELPRSSSPGPLYDFQTSVTSQNRVTSSLSFEPPRPDSPVTIFNRQQAGLSQPFSRPPAPMEVVAMEQSQYTMINPAQQHSFIVAPSSSAPKPKSTGPLSTGVVAPPKKATKKKAKKRDDDPSYRP